MKKIINGKIYDTETNMAIAFYEASSNTSSRYYYSERLYMTDNGDFYLHGTGGSFTQYATVREDGGKDPGEDIILLPTEKAKRWVKLRYNYGLIVDHHFTSIIAVLRL